MVLGGIEVREIKDTQAKVNSVTPLINREEYPCGNALLLVVESKKKGGGKSFAGRMRFQGKQRTIWIGSTKKWKLKSAREQFELIKCWSRTNKRDPKEFGSKETEIKPSQGKTFGFLIKEYLKYKTDVKPITLRNYRNQLNQVLQSIEGSTPLTELEWDNGGREKVMGMKRDIERPGRESFDQADRIQRLLCQVFDYAISEHGFPRAQNPAIRHKGEIKKHKPKHNPTITWKEVPKFLQVVSENKCKGGIITDLAVKTLLMTFLRVGALCRLEWDWYDEESDCWIIPSETSGLKRRKGVDDKPHHIPMTEPLREVMNILRRYTGHQKYVFWSFRGKQYEHLCLDQPNRHLINLGYRGLLTAHGWRSVPMSAGQDVLKFPPETIQRQMAHLLGDKTRQAYDNSLDLKERREFMNAWCDALLENGLKV